MTNTTASIILRVLLALPPHQEDTDWPYRDAELQPLAEAIAQTAKTPQEAAGLVTVAYEESRLARYVGDGRCHEGPPGARCDNGRARGYFQLWQVACPQAYRFKAGTIASLKAEVVCARRLLVSGYKRCQSVNPAGSWAGAFAIYGTGHSCEAPWSEHRQSVFYTILRAVTNETTTH